MSTRSGGVRGKAKFKINVAYSSFTKKRNGTMQRIGILKVDVSARKARPTTDLVAEEAPLSLLLNSTHLVTLLCSPPS